MKKTISKVFAMLLAVMLFATQLVAPTFAASACTCEGDDFTNRTGTFAYSVFAPTCKEEGMDVYTCDKCGGSYNVLVNPTNTHSWGDLITDTAKDATCTEAGSRAYSLCAVCGVKGIDDGGAFVAIDNDSALVIPAIGHNYKEVVTDPTCTEAGYTTHTCQNANCGDSYVDTEVEAKGHDWATMPAQTADCTQIGWEEYEYCTVCNIAPDYVEIPREIHPFEETTEPATCVTEGKYIYTCTKEGCPKKGTPVEEIIPALGHTANAAVKENVIAPTCTTDGGYDTVVYCAVCDSELSREHIDEDALGHTMVTVEAKAATCTEKGNKAYNYCSTCFTVEEDGDYADLAAIEAAYEIPATGHLNIESHNEKAATCTDAGYTNGIICNDCGTVLREGNVVPALGHIFVEHDAKAPTCQAEGWEAYQTCSRCTYTDKVTIEKIPHSDANIIGQTAATCTEKGKIVYQCLNSVEGGECNHVYSVETPALGHTPAAAVKENEQAAKCTETGSYDNVVYCTVCNAELSRNSVTVPALGHTTVTVSAQAATCVTDGWMEFGYCSACDEFGDEASGKIAAENTIEALGHNMLDVDAKIATYDQKGHDVGKKCSRCDHFEGTGEVAALNESVKFSLELSGINGVANAVNSGYVYANIYMSVLADSADTNNIEAIARISAANMKLNFDGNSFSFVGVEAYMLDTYMTNKNANDVSYVNITQAMAPGSVKTCKGDKILYATLKFKVNGDAATANYDFTISKDTIDYDRFGSYVNTTACANDADITDTIAVELIGNTDGKVAYTATDLVNMSTYLANPEADYADGYLYDMDKSGMVDFADYELLMSAVAGNSDHLQIG